MTKHSDFFQWTMRSLYYDQSRCDESAIDQLWSEADQITQQNVYNLSVEWTQELARASSKSYKWLVDHVPPFEQRQ